SIPVPQGSGRGGILTQAGILMQTGTGDRTSIVERGAFVARKFLNDPPGDPPPLVSDLPTNDESFAMMTGAQLVQAHRDAPQCAACHNKIDPLGTGLEEFDAVGQFRTVDKRLNPNIDQLTRRQRRRKENFFFEVPLETSGKVGRRSFEGAQGLKKALIGNVDRVAEAYTGALLSMANGRESGVADETIIKDIVKRAKKVGLPARSILIAVLHSDAFKTQ
ncbi:DUF1588 domain-containing protein, partial [bacterium]|nr:DUF1588 domain-containing protein [bacterium]